LGILPLHLTPLQNQLVNLLECFIVGANAYTQAAVDSLHFYLDGWDGWSTYDDSDHVQATVYTKSGAFLSGDGAMGDIHEALSACGLPEAHSMTVDIYTNGHEWPMTHIFSFTAKGLKNAMRVIPNDPMEKWEVLTPHA
jgi:hypothetical protein